MRVRDLASADIPLVNGYWANLTPADLERMSIDPTKLATRYLHVNDFKKTVNLPFRERTSDLLIWELSERMVGMSSLRNILYAEYAEIHLHMTDSRHRRSGYGHRFFALSLQEYFRRFELHLIVCEPSSRNPGPNRLLQKLGFQIARIDVTKPSPISLEHEVNRYEITQSAMSRLMATLRM